METRSKPKPKKKKQQEQQKLYRYTSLPALFYILTNQKLTLLPYSLWDDKNDSYFLNQYKDKLELKTVLALCFSTKPQTYHHWRVFAHGPAGVCITFDRQAIIDAIKEQEKKLQNGEMLFGREVTYMSTKTNSLKTEELPFIKRKAFQDEKEWRILYQFECKETECNRKETYDICIPISSIIHVTLSPWLPNALQQPLKDIIKKIDQCNKLVIFSSTILNNEKWRKLADM